MERDEYQDGATDPALSGSGPGFPRIETLEDRFVEARGAASGDPVADADRLAALEQEWLGLRADLAREAPDLADDRGHPALAEVSRWRMRCDNLELDAVVERTDRLLEELVEDEVGAWIEHARTVAAGDDADVCYDLLAQATALRRDAMAREGPDPDFGVMEEARHGLRETLLRLVEATPATLETRRRWVTELLDRADVVLTSLDDLAPAAAADQLVVVADDLAWHVQHVERKNGTGRRRLKKKLRRVRAELQERNLQGRLEGMFGAKNVGRFERLILYLIVLVLALLAIELIVDLSPRVQYWFTIADTLACVIFLYEFFFRLALVKGKRRWFLRHALVDLLPSIPFGLLMLHHGGPDPIRAGRAVRLLRLTRVARYVRVLMPVIRIVRALGFLTRGSDRLVRRYGHLLNRDIILYPTRDEWAHARAALEGPGARMHRLRAELGDLWDDLLTSVPEARRADVAAARVRGVEAARAQGVTRRPPSTKLGAGVARAIPADLLLERLSTTTPETIEAEMGADFVARGARVIRIFSRPPLRWIPVLKRYLPTLGPRMSDAAVTAAASRQLARGLRRQHERWFFFADLYGTVTPAEFVDRVGATMVKSAFRPAYRLTLFGTLFLLVDFLLSITPSPFLQSVSETLGRFVGQPLLILGGICAVVLAVGWWMKRLASAATTFYEQTVTAQYLPLMESIKGRFLERDAALLVNRVLAPELVLRGEASAEDRTIRLERFVEGVKAWLLKAHALGDASGAFDAMERTVLLYRDGMDGAILDESDTRTTNQLLGNPAMRTLRRTAWCVTKRERKEMAALDLLHQRRLLGGPYLWFSLITRAAGHSAARLIVEYNRRAIPLAEIPLASQEERAAYDAWLGGSRLDSREEAKTTAEAGAGFLTTAFTALHFLDADPQRDHEVEQRFGKEVCARMLADRRALMRRIFGTFPLHTRPHEQRVVNLYRFYEDWLAGGRAILLPLRGLWGGVRWIGRIASWVVKAIREIKHPPLRQEVEREAQADFATAMRKIDRMRGPVVRACLWLRARVDCEYVGVRLPGARHSGMSGGTVGIDLDFLGASADFRAQVEEEHDAAQADMRRLTRLHGEGLFSRVGEVLGVGPEFFEREQLRAAVFAYRADVHGVRSLLSSEDILRESFVAAARQPLRPGFFWPHLRQWWSFRRAWKQYGEGDNAARKAAWRALRHDVNGAARALRVWKALGAEEAAAEGERRLTDLMRHPGRLGEQLVTLRAVQTLGLIDVLNYRAHVWRVGGYEADGENAGRRLTL